MDVVVQRSNGELLGEIRKQIDALEKEVEAVYSALVLPHWLKELHGFPQTLYGYMMRVFAFVDLLSAYWKGNNKNQSSRMIAFMNKYMRPEQEANSVALQMWRHKLMHTAQPRPLKDARTGKTYCWLLHWHDHLPKERHYTFNDTTDTRILNIGLVYLIGDLKQAALNYEAELLASVELQSKVSRFQTKLDSLKYRDYRAITIASSRPRAR